MITKHSEILNDREIIQWHENEKKALQLINLVGDLRFDRSIELLMFRRSIYDSRPSEVIQYHQHSSNYSEEDISLDDSLKLANAITNIKGLAPARIDIGILAVEWQDEKDEFSNPEEFISHKLGNFIGDARQGTSQKDVVLYGFGRIGRLLTRRIIELTGKGEQLRLKAIVLRSKMNNREEEIQKRIALLRSDSIHGKFHGTIDMSPDKSSIIINGNRVFIIFAKEPGEINYKDYGINNALLIDNTGVWRDKEDLSQHISSGITNVILTAPGKDIPNIVHGVNQNELDLDTEKIISAASCTTNAIVPIIKVLDSNFRIERGHIETIHSYTSDQNLLDNFHKKPRRGRAAAVNMVLTTTGAAKAVTKVLPNLDGKLTGNSVRVPTPNASLAIISVGIKNPVSSVEEVNKVLKEACFHGELVEQIHYSASTEYVSSHAVGMTTTSVLDAPSTIVSADGKNLTIYAWYDNEYGYSCQVVRLAKHVARVRRHHYY